MDIMAASVHDRHVVTGRIGRARRAGVGKTGVLPHGQCVHVSAHQYGRAVAIAQHANYAGAADAFAHFVSRFPQSVRGKAGSSMFLMRQFRVLMDVAVEDLLPGSDCAQVVQDGSCIRSGPHRL